MELDTEEILKLKERMPHNHQSASNIDSDLESSMRPYLTLKGIREGRDSMHGNVKYRFKNDPKCFQNRDSCFICDLHFGKLKNKRHHWYPPIFSKLALLVVFALSPVAKNALRVK